MFADLAFLVEQQGEMLDSIQHSVGMASMYIEEGNALYEKAVESRIGMSMMMLAPGLVIRNESDVKILVILSQLTPLHWEAIDPGHTVRMRCGRVFFTVSAEAFDEKKVPRKREVAGRLAAITASTTLAALTGPLGLVAGAAAGLTVSGTMSGVTSVKEASINGVYANGKTVVFGGRWNYDTKEYYLFCDGTEKTKSGQKYNRPAIIRSELVGPTRSVLVNSKTLPPSVPTEKKEQKWRPGALMSKMMKKMSTNDDTKDSGSSGDA